MTPSEIRAHAVEINDDTVKLLKDSRNPEAVTLVNLASASVALWEIAAQIAELNAKLEPQAIFGVYKIVANMIAAMESDDLEERRLVMKRQADAE